MMKEKSQEIKPFGYRIRRFFMKRVLKLKAQKKMKSNNPYDYDEEPGIPPDAEQVALAAYSTIQLGDERILLLTSYCKKCKNQSVRLFSEKARKVICLGCGKELAKL